MAIQRKRRDGIPSQPKSQRITLPDAIELTARHRRASPASEHGGFFWGVGIRAVLDQPGCTGIRYYHGLHADGQYKIVIVGVDDDGNDITGPASAPTAYAGKSGKIAKTAKSMKSSDGAVLLDFHYPCPPFCPPGSPLA